MQSVIAGPILSFRGKTTSAENHTWNVCVLIVTEKSVTDVQMKDVLKLPEREKFECQKLSILNNKDGESTAEIDLGFNCWRCDLDITMEEQQKIFSYQVCSKSYSFAVPAKNQNPRILYISCNNNDEVNQAETKGFQANWRDIMDSHRINNFHLALGGGDQVYADAVLGLPSLEQWLELKDDHPKICSAPYTAKMDAEVLKFLTDLYLSYLTKPFYSDAVSSMPFINMNDDHEYCDGFGSYPSMLQNSPVMQGIFRRAQQTFLLFQLHTTLQEANSRGYFGSTITDTISTPQAVTYSLNSLTVTRQSFSYIRDLGELAILVSDGRGERTRDRILSQASWDMAFQQLQRISPQCKHLFVMLGIPLVFPDLTGLDKIWDFGDPYVNTNQFTYAIARTVFSLIGQEHAFGVDSGTDNVNYDAWGSVHHQEERNMVVTRLQQFARNRKVRVTLLSGDTHIASAGVLKENADVFVAPSFDPTFIVQLTSSGVGSWPNPASHAVLEAAAVAEKKQTLMKTNGKNIIGEMVKWEAEKPSGGTPYFIGHRNWMVLQIATAEGLGQAKAGDILSELFVETKGNTLLKKIPPEKYFLIVPVLQEEKRTSIPAGQVDSPGICCCLIS